jgi:release factor glutamine methyltransferase
MDSSSPQNPGHYDLYSPTVSAEHAEQIRRWHDRAYGEARAEGISEQTFSYLGLSIVVPPDVMPVTGMASLLGEAVLAETTPTDVVLDMGTGSGVNAVLAATRGAEVVAVDINPRALEAALDNAERNGVVGRVKVHYSDVFSEISGVFDLIIFDPPFRWFRPRDMLEAAMTDEGYRAMTRFFREARSHLSARGRMLISFGTSGDLGYLEKLLHEEGFVAEVVAHNNLVREGWNVDYFAFRVT